MGGIFLAFLAFFPFVIGNIFQFTFFKNLTSLIILIGVITDVSSQYEVFWFHKIMRVCNNRRLFRACELA